MTFEWLSEMYIAHRGLHSEKYPENSIIAFKEAIKNEFAIEFDLHILRDNNVIVFHDNDFKRMTGFRKLVKDSCWEEIKDLKLLNTNEKIPLFKDVLKYVDGKVPLMIELKNRGKVGRLEKVVYDLLKDYEGQYVIQSFNPFSLAWFRKNAPNVIRGQLSGSYKHENLPRYKKFILKNMLLNCFSKPHFINYEINALKSLAITFQRLRGNLILGWTAQSEEQFKRAKRYCANVVFEGFNPRDIN